MITDVLMLKNTGSNLCNAQAHGRAGRPRSGWAGCPMQRFVAPRFPIDIRRNPGIKGVPFETVSFIEHLTEKHVKRTFEMSPFSIVTRRPFD